MKPARRKPGRPRYDDVLTPMEWRVLHAAQHGSSNRAIAASLGVSIDGVKFHVTNILGKLELPNRRALKSWFSVPRNSALARYAGDYHAAKEDYEMTLQTDSVTTVESLGQVARTVRSLEESIDFYQHKLGIPHLYSFGKLGFLNIAGARLFLQETEEWNRDESILYFRVGDIVSTCAALGDGGVEISNQPHLIHTHGDGTEEWMAFLEDPEGRPLGLMSALKRTEAASEP